MMCDCLCTPITLGLPDGFGLGTLQPYYTLIPSLRVSHFSVTILVWSASPMLMGDRPGLTPLLEQTIKRRSGVLLTLSSSLVKAKSSVTVANSSKVARLQLCLQR